MKVLIVSRKAGNSKHKVNKYDVRSYILDQANAIEKEGINVTHFLIESGGIKGYAKGINNLRKEINKNTYDIIHVHFGLTAIVCLFQFKLPFVITFHGSDINNPKLRFISNFVMKFAKHNIVVSKYLNDKVNSENVSIIPCGVDLDAFYPMKNQSLHRVLKENHYNVLFAGAFYMLPKNYSLAKQVIEGLQIEKPINLIELKGFGRDEVNVLLNQVDCVLMTSKSEGSPQIIKEAMACNCPIVSTDVGDVRDLLKGTTSCHIADFNPLNIIQALKDILTLNVRSNGREHIKYLDNKIISKRVLEVYKKVLE
jgi:glycosyltransferase involved in cell wall biosynthesis